MTRRPHLAVLLTVVTAAPAFAQSQASVYDFMIGTWRFMFQARSRDGSFTPSFTGHWVFTKKPDKFLWRADATFDRGQTWIRDYWAMEVHRISR